MHHLTGHVVHPRAGSPPFRTNRELRLAAVRNLTVHAQDHVRAERKAPKRAIAHLLLRLRILHVCRDAQLAARAFPTGEHGPNARLGVVLVEQRLARKVRRLNLRSAQVGGIAARAVAAWGRVCDAADGQRRGHARIKLHPLNGRGAHIYRS